MTTLLDFHKCAECSAKPGSPKLCDTCLHNRSVIHNLRDICKDAALGFRQLGRPQEAVVIEGALGIRPLVAPKVSEEVPVPGVSEGDRLLMQRFVSLRAWAADVLGLSADDVCVGFERDSQDSPDIGAYFNPSHSAPSARIVIYKREVPSE